MNHRLRSVGFLDDSVVLRGPSDVDEKFGKDDISNPPVSGANEIPIPDCLFAVSEGPISISSDFSFVHGLTSLPVRILIMEGTNPRATSRRERRSH